METIAISCFLLSIPDFKLYLVHRFRNNCIIHLSTNPIAQFKKPQCSPLRRPYSDKISHKLGFADKCISDT